MYNFVTSVRTSQAQWLVGVTSFEDYKKRRLETVGSEPCVMAMQWGYGLSLPSHIWDHEATQTIIREVGISVFLYNDIASLKKEVIDGDVDSTVPILVWNEGITAQAAVLRIQKMIEESWERLIAAEKRLKSVTNTQQLKQDAEILIGGCKDIVVGHMAYSLRASRYMSSVTFLGAENSFQFVL